MHKATESISPEEGSTVCFVLHEARQHMKSWLTYRWDELETESITSESTRRNCSGGASWTWDMASWRRTAGIPISSQDVVLPQRSDAETTQTSRPTLHKPCAPSSQGQRSKVKCHWQKCWPSTWHVFIASYVNIWSPVS